MTDGLHVGSNRHIFGRKRPSVDGVHPIHHARPRDTHFRELPEPTGQAPFHLDLQAILSTSDYATIVQHKTLIFHLNGDMGGIKYDVPQHLVAKGMERDLKVTDTHGSTPSFLYVTGDCVYFNGSVDEYYPQFYEPYEFYHRPIFAVPGNHDGENLGRESSLNGFVRNFCAPEPVKREESRDSHRTAMVQPNVYWVLNTPVCNIVGLYSNVPEGGEIRDPQLSWFIDQLKTLPTNVPLFIALHHPIYSADDHHSGSSHMRTMLNTAATAAGRYPDMVLAGHVHDYQRLSSRVPGVGLVPHIVTGAGGYHNLHGIMKVDGETMIPPVAFQAGNGEAVTLEKYSDDHHGFLRIEVNETKVTGRYYQVPRPQEAYSKGNQLIDYWEYDWRQRQWIENQL